MKIKRYIDKDMRQVLRRIREDQGPEAVILSNRRIDDGIEVIAAVDYDEALVRHALGTEAKIPEKLDRESLVQVAEDDDTVESAVASNKPEVINASLTPAAALVDDSAAILADTELQVPVASSQDVQTELSSLRNLLETQLSGLLWQDANRRYPMRANVHRGLARLGVAADVANIIVNRLGPSTDQRELWRASLTTLAKTIPVVNDTLLEEGGVAALVGPTGVGKTTTIAKMAVRYAMQHGADDIALVCADAYRIGAKEHLMAFANIIGVGVHAVGNSAELNSVLNRLKSKKLVLIDTEGRSQRDRDLASRLAAYGNNDERVNFYLALSAASQEAGIDETVRAFNDVPLKGCVVTKVDEAAQLGCVISTLIRNDLPVAWLSDGQRIPEDLHAADKKKLWLVNQALECMKSSKPRLDEQILAENFAQASVAHA